MRHLEPLAFLLHAGGKAHDLARDQPQPLVATELLALVEEHLHADADAEQRLAGGHMGQQRLDETAGAQVADAVAKGADAGEHHLVGRGDIPGIGADPRREAELLEGLLDAAQVAHLIINDIYHSQTYSSLPLLESTPSMRGSRPQASSRARAKALKTASMMWCRLSP